MGLLNKYGININSIESINIYLDDNVPECMDGVLRIGSVIISTITNQEFDIQEFVDNSEFYSEKAIENFVNKTLGTSIATVKMTSKKALEI